MKKILFALVFLCTATSCQTYTVKNDLEKNIKAGGLLIKPGECAEYIDFLYIFGDFPFKFIYEDGSFIKDKEYGPADYKISRESVAIQELTSIVIKEVTQPCKR